MADYDAIVVGAGFAGAVFAERIASVSDLRVLVIDRRSHLGGNAFDYKDDNGVLVHKYGPHIFHSNSKKVVDYLSGFTDWTPYSHVVHGLVGERSVPIPFNLTSIEIAMPDKAEKLKRKLVSAFGAGNKVSIQALRRSEDSDIKKLAEYIFEHVFLNYTTKQWGISPEDVDPSILARVPIYTDHDPRYFKDTHQAMPTGGYTKLFERLLDHPNITLELGRDFSELGYRSLKEQRLVYTGSIDALCEYEYGPLPYRSLSFRFQHYKQRYHQAVAQYNYPTRSPYTRVTEFKHFPGSTDAKGTTVAVEYPEAHEVGKNERYYPIASDENRKLYKRYKALAEERFPGIVLVGRLAEYKYYNMDQVILKTLRRFAE